MNIGPIQIRWTKDVKAEQAKTQRIDLRQNRCIAGQYHDIQALRKTVEEWRPWITALASRREAKTPRRVGAAI